MNILANIFCEQSVDTVPDPDPPPKVPDLTASRPAIKNLKYMKKKNYKY